MSAQPADRFDTVRLGLVAALLEGDAGAAFHQVLALLDDGVPFDEVLFDVLAPIQGDVGRRWADGDYRVGDEHAVSAAVETVVAMLAGSFDQPVEGRRVVVTAAEGDTHSLPARVLSAHLSGAGFRVTNLGPTLPADDLGAFLAENDVDVLVLTCSMPSHLWGARRCIEAAHAVGVPVVAGGRGFGPDAVWAITLGADVWVEDGRELAAVVGALEADVEAAEEAVLISASDRMAGRIGSVLAVAAELGDEVPDADASLLWSDVQMYVNTLDASLLVDDALPLVELARWHEDLLAEARPAFTAAQVLGRLEAILGEADPRVAGFVAQASASTD